MLLQLRGIQKRNAEVSVTIHIINLSTAMTDGFGEMKRQPDRTGAMAACNNPLTACMSE